MIAVITDTHLSGNTIDVNLSIFSQAIQECKKRGLTKLYHNGDFITSRKNMSMDDQNALDEIMDMFYEAGITLIAITGNHDIKSDMSNVKKSWLRPYRFHPGLCLVEEPKLISEECFQTVSIPFMEADKFMEVMETLDITNKEKTVLLIHQEVYGSVNNSGKPVKNGIPINVFDDYGLVLCGHFHDRQKISSTVWYMGAAYPSNFGENNDKGLTIVNDDLSVEFVQFDFKKYITVNVDMSSTSKKELDKLIKEWGYNENNVRFVFSGDEALVKAIDFDILKSNGIEYTMKSSKIVEDDSAAENTTISEETVVYDRNNIPNEFENFCKEKGIEDNQRGLSYLNKRLNKNN